ncbi:histidine-rich glycoprotein-like [Olea europaea var. sylvestris]|uniref:histidine-rich glycoprotein-like n=1 Tax=Olea europaea var. sylvestris TaxID=158386 RepID=UPI000C1D8234|nr:histidine-rich glycoprotein-like [Olea europaea var. sylvestris]
MTTTKPPLPLQHHHHRHYRNHTNTTVTIAAPQPSPLPSHHHDRPITELHKSTTQPQIHHKTVPTNPHNHRPHHRTARLHHHCSSPLTQPPHHRHTYNNSVRQYPITTQSTLYRHHPNETITLSHSTKSKRLQTTASHRCPSKFTTTMQSTPVAPPLLHIATNRGGC